MTCARLSSVLVVRLAGSLVRVCTVQICQFRDCPLRLYHHMRAEKASMLHTGFSMKASQYTLMMWRRASRLARMAHLGAKYHEWKRARCMLKRSLGALNSF